MSERGLATMARGAARANVSLALLVIAYGAVLFVFSRFSHAHGLITPEGSVDVVYGALGIAVLALRGGVLFVVPGVVAYRLARSGLAAAARRSRGRPPSPLSPA